mmetsp:Transcript_12908/g.36314  ORF Transcript_12908/g.36314 Transcript_12908/m.36314 type:complete len:281 (-) Transcript_12908:180-1022(-)
MLQENLCHVYCIIMMGNHLMHEGGDGILNGVFHAHLVVHLAVDGVHALQELAGLVVAQERLSGANIGTGPRCKSLGLIRPAHCIEIARLVRRVQLWRGSIGCHRVPVGIHKLDASAHSCVDMAEVKDHAALSKCQDLWCDGQLDCIGLLQPGLFGVIELRLVAVEVLRRLDPIDEVHKRVRLHLILVVMSAVGIVCKPKRVHPVGVVCLIEDVCFANLHLQLRQHAIVSLDLEVAGVSGEEVDAELVHRFLVLCETTEQESGADHNSDQHIAPHVDGVTG